ncbi:hypothetical protein CK227_04665 [Mesorhizobium sp. WSM4308]|nr:hypothetical protein CK232_08970 [Mesorhizobium sp. WSM4304]PBB76743.1 hypothetical protein CK227_04665 [Mesorhizobium sp. WSM4308]
MAVLEKGPVEEGTVRHVGLRSTWSVALYDAPLCPAGHLPHKGGDRLSSRLSLNFYVARSELSRKLPISPQVGEMSGRTEGGAAPPASPS